MQSQPGGVDSVFLPSCQVCGRQDETLRIVSYPFVISVIFVTFWRAFSGIWCRRHRRRYLFLSSVISASLGWLGFPYGIFSTPITLFKLARGGNMNPLQNFTLMNALAEQKLRNGDTHGAIRCFEECLKFQDDPEVRQKLSRLYQQYRPETLQAGLSTLTSLMAVPGLMFMAVVIGAMVGILDIVFVYLLGSVTGSAESIFVAILSWVPLVVMTFLAVLLVCSRTEWTLNQIRSENRSLALALAILASTFAMYSILEGRALISSVSSLLAAYSFSVKDVLFGGRAILAYGGILELINSYQAQQTFGIIYLVLFSAGAVCSFYIGITTAVESVQWQARLAEIRKSLTIDFGNSSTSAWLWLAGIVVTTILFVAVLSAGRFVNVEKANQHFANATIATANADSENTLSELKKAVALWPESVRGHASLGLAYLNQEEYDLAFSEAETALRYDPKSVGANLLMGFVRSYRSEFDQAIENLKIVEGAQPNWGVPHAYLALLYYLSDQTDLRQREIQLALAHEEGDGQTSYLIATYYSSVRDYTEAEKHLLKAIQLPSVTPDEYFMLARLYSTEKKFDLAKDAINKAGNLKAKEVDIHLAKSDLFISQEDLDSAASELASALISSPNNSIAHGDLSFVYFQQGRIADAAKEAELAITTNPFNAVAYIEQAFAYHEQGRLTEALSAAQKAVTSSPKYDRGHYILGLSYMDIGMKTEAIREFKIFLDLYYERPYVKQYKENAEKYLVQLQQ